ncbi:unnamed protein product [Moneuplotes crassus]|uniref:Uncharacterized protein n=1 Tax=Euplotes crassus TaxID=5936 RepID=A0AAD2D437_EUPCR|nr:unnamed protein product [Moneuplotes crassus]
MSGADNSKQVPQQTQAAVAPSEQAKPMGRFQRLKAKISETPMNLDFEKLRNTDWKALRRSIIRVGPADENEFNAFSTKASPEKEPPLISKEFIEKYKSLGLEESYSYNEDVVADFNRKNLTLEELESLVPIPGAFYKCRNKGGASSVDLDKNNVFYKRCLATFSLLIVNTYVVITILYDAKIISPENKRVYRLFPLISYPGVVLGFCGFLFYKNSQMNKELDRKYTPLWKHILEQTKKAKEANEVTE